MKKKTILEKWKHKSIAMMMAGIMVFAMAPLGTGIAFADEENAEPAGEPTVEAVEDVACDEFEDVVVDEAEDVTVDEEAAAVEADEVIAAQGTVEAKAATTIKASQITDDMLTFRNNKGYLVSGQNTILYIDKDITLHGVLANDRVWDYDNRVWSGSFYDLTIRGDGQHTLTILADINGEDALEANNITMESGNVEATLTDPVNAVDAKNDFYMKGGNLKVNVHATGWTNFYVPYNLVVSGGNLTVLDTDAERSTNGAILCGSLTMTGGTVRGESIKGDGLDISYGATISGGKIDAVGRSAGIDCGEAFKMTGGSITGTATRDDDSNFWRAFNFGRTAPVFGANVKITDPKGGKIGTHYYDGADHYVVVDANDNKVRSAKIEYVKPAPKAVAKKANTLNVTAKKVMKIKAKKMKKKAKSFNISKFVTVSGAQGAVTYAKAAGNKKITVASNGRVTLKKKIKKGTYKVKVNVTAAGNAGFNAVTKAVTFKVKVK